MLNILLYAIFFFVPRHKHTHTYVVVQLLSCVRFLATSSTEAHQASLFFTISWSLLRLHVHWVSDATQPSHPLPLPQSPKDWSLLLSRIQGYCYHLSKFHIYALVYCIGVGPFKACHKIFKILAFAVWCIVHKLLHTVLNTVEPLN